LGNPSLLELPGKTKEEENELTRYLDFRRRIDVKRRVGRGERFSGLKKN